MKNSFHHRVTKVGAIPVAIVSVAYLQVRLP